MDSLTRWSVSLLAGATAGIALISGYMFSVTDIQAKTQSFALNQVGDNTLLDAKVQLNTYSIEELSAFADMAQDANLKSRYIDCGGYGNPTQICTMDATIPDGLELVGAELHAAQPDATVTLGRYASQHEDILEAADTVIAETDRGPQAAANEGGGVFTASYFSRDKLSITGEPWQYTLATVPASLAWLASGSAAAIITVLFSVVLRARKDPEVEAVGVEFFDRL